jgi:hypothetical protein
VEQTLRFALIPKHFTSSLLIYNKIQIHVLFFQAPRRMLPPLGVPPWNFQEATVWSNIPAIWTAFIRVIRSTDIPWKQRWRCARLVVEAEQQNMVMPEWFNAESISFQHLDPHGSQQMPTL